MKNIFYWSKEKFKRKDIALVDINNHFSFYANANRLVNIGGIYFNKTKNKSVVYYVYGINNIYKALFLIKERKEWKIIGESVDLF